MRETVRTLRLYFIVSSLLAVPGNLLILVLSQGNLLMVGLALIGLGFCGVFFYIGAVLPRLLAESPRTVTRVIYAGMAFLVMSFPLTLAEGVRFRPFVFLILGLLICWYLLQNVKRLSAEARGASPQRQSS